MIYSQGAGGGAAEQGIKLNQQLNDRKLVWNFLQLSRTRTCKLLFIGTQTHRKLRHMYLKLIFAGWILMVDHDQRVHI